MENNNLSIIREAVDEIETALRDPRGIVLHQTRLILSFSAGGVALIENYLGNLGALKPGFKINHLWLKKKRENVEKILSNCILTPTSKIPKLGRLLDLSFLIEYDRNEFAYGKRISEDELRKKINLFLELKKEAEND